MRPQRAGQSWPARRGAGMSQHVQDALTHEGVHQHQRSTSPSKKERVTIRKHTLARRRGVRPTAVPFAAPRVEVVSDESPCGRPMIVECSWHPCDGVAAAMRFLTPWYTQEELEQRVADGHGIVLTVISCA